MFHNFGIFLSALLFTYFSYLAGFQLFSAINVRFEDAAKRRVLAIITGYGLFGFLGMVLGVVGFFKPLLFWIFALILLLFSAGIVRTHFGMIFSRSWWLSFFETLKSYFAMHGFFKAMLVLWVTLNVFIVFVPLTGHDTLEYHFPIIQSIIDEGKFTFNPTIPSYAFLPVFGETLYASAMTMFGNSVEPYVFQVLQYGMLILFPFLIYVFLKRKITHPILLLLCSLGILGIMDFGREVFHGGYIDLFGFLFGMSSVLLVADNIASGAIKRSEMMLSAILLGFSLGVKYTALFFGAVSALLLLLYFIRARVRFSEVVKVFGIYGGSVLLTAGFWYLKNLVVFGNPIHPLISMPEWTANVNYFLLDRTILNFLIFPFVRFGQWFVQDVETSSRLLVLGYFIVFYLLLATFAFMKKRLAVFTWALFIFLELYMGFLFMSSHQYRFLIPVMLLLPPLLALLVDRLLLDLRGSHERFYEKTMKTLRVCAYFAVIILFLANLHYFEVKFRYAFGDYDRTEYINEIGGQ